MAMTDLTDLDRQGFSSDTAALTNKLCRMMDQATNRRQIGQRLRATIRVHKQLSVNDFGTVMAAMGRAYDRIRQGELQAERSPFRYNSITKSF